MYKLNILSLTGLNHTDTCYHEVQEKDMVNIETYREPHSSNDNDPEFIPLDSIKKFFGDNAGLLAYNNKLIINIIDNIYYCK